MFHRKMVCVEVLEMDKSRTILRYESQDVMIE